MRLPQGLFVFRALSFKKVDTKLVLTGSSEEKKKKKQRWHTLSHSPGADDKALGDVLYRP